MTPGTGPDHDDGALQTPRADRRSILLVYQHGRRGAAALAEARRAVRADADRLTVVTLAAAQPYVRCGPSGDAVDAAVVDAAGRELAEARRALGPLADHATFEILRGDADAALRRLVEREAFDVVLAPRRQRRLLGSARRPGD
jgi:hypothetical protein